jgi:hypothetical protein
VAAVAVGVGAGDRPLVELGEQDVRDGVMNGLGGVLKNVGEADVKAAVTQADRGVQRGETAESDVECGDGRARTEFAVLVFKDGYEGSGRGKFSGAGFFRCGRVMRGRLKRGLGFFEEWRRRRRR